MGIELWGREWGRAPHNHWEHIYLAHWVWPRGGTAADYERGSGFFRVHWEMVRPDRPNQVSFHVEAPRADVDEHLNELKVALIDGLLSTNVESVALAAGMEFICRNWRRETVAGQKLTSAFAVVLPTGWQTDSAFADMVRVHECLGATIEPAIQDLAPRISARFR